MNVTEACPNVTPLRNILHVTEDGSASEIMTQTHLIQIMQYRYTPDPLLFRFSVLIITFFHHVNSIFIFFNHIYNKGRIEILYS